ncbi:MAG: M15 family metallopeptidase [Acidimicrobiales bacterium]|nr:M15 family metallopeptidase [Acidimicrobiales bacterium]
MSPLFNEPVLTHSATEVLAAAGVSVPVAGPIPLLVDPPHPIVRDGKDEPLVLLDHPRIMNLENYHRAGWCHALPGCRLRESVAERLGRVANSLPARWGLAVFDGWRPHALQVELHSAAYADPCLPPGFFAEPDERSSTPSPHLTGGSVDLTLSLDEIPLAPGTGFDDLTPRAYTRALEDEPGANRDIRRLLYHAMVAEGFVVFDGEWWHFEYGTRRWSAITGRPPKFGSAINTEN